MPSIKLGLASLAIIMVISMEIIVLFKVLVLRSWGVGENQAIAGKQFSYL